MSAARPLVSIVRKSRPSRTCTLIPRNNVPKQCKQRWFSTEPEPAEKAPEPIERGNALEYSKLPFQDRVKLYDTITGIAVHPDVDLNSPYKKLSDEEIAKLPPDDAYFKTPRKDSWAAEVLAGKMELADLPAADAGQSVKADESLLDNPPDRIKGLAHRILSQSIIEDAAMKKLLREKIDIGDEHLELMFGDGFPLEEGMATGGGGGGGGGGAAAAAEPVKEKDAFDVKLAAVDAKAKIKIIKEVRTITGLGLKEAKELVEKAPVVIKQGVSKDEAAELEKVLKGVGAEVELV